MKAEKDRIQKEGLNAPEQIDFSFVQPGMNLDFLKKKEELPDYDVFKINKRKAQKHNIEQASPLQRQMTMKKQRSKSKKRNQTMMDDNVDESGIKPFSLNQHDMTYQDNMGFDGNETFQSPMLNDGLRRDTDKPLIINQFNSNNSS